nr:hypothetical protein [Chthoniobacterales bacterium]
APDQPVSKAALLPDGSVVLSGKFQVAGQSGTFSLAKLTATGAYDGSFNPPSVANAAGPARAAVISNVRLAPDGRIWVLGRFDSIGGTPAPGVARLNPDGSLDSTFQLTGVEHYDYTNDRTDVVFADARTAYLVGTFRRPGEPVPFAVTRIVNIGPALQLTGAVSRKTHSGLGDFSIDLPLTGQSGVECRSGGADGNHTLVFTFTNNVVSGNANVTGGTGSASGAPIFSGNTMTVNLTGVSNGQTVMVTLDNVTDALSQVLPVATVSASFLLGDTNGNRSVNASDIGQTKSYSGQTTDATNFRGDVNLSGTVNASDIGLVKSRAGTSLPP